MADLMLPPEKDPARTEGDKVFFARETQQEYLQHKTEAIVATTWTWLVFPSTHVHMAKFCPWPYHNPIGDLYMEFLDGCRVVYHMVPFEMWHEFMYSVSKGMYKNQFFKTWPYDTIIPKQRKVTKAMQEANFNKTSI